MLIISLSGDELPRAKKCASTLDSVPTVLRSVVDQEWVHFMAVHSFLHAVLCSYYRRATISAGSVVELSTVGKSVCIGSSCIVSYVTLKVGHW